LVLGQRLLLGAKVGNSFTITQGRPSMKLVSTAWTLVVLLAVVGSLRAQDQATPAHKPHPPAMGIPGLDKLTLTDDQKASLADLRKEYGPKMSELGAKIRAILTDEQIKARHEAEKEARAAGKSPKEIGEAVDAAMKLSDDQKTKMAEVRQEMQPLQQEFRKKVLAILTPEQRKQLMALLGGGHKPKKSDDNK
jgi:Spy/CpxP family protein refolding chaperone